LARYFSFAEKSFGTILASTASITPYKILFIPLDKQNAMWYTYYLDAFIQSAAFGDGRDAADCRCHGGGWLLSEVDTWHKCPDHFTGQIHPEVACDCDWDCEAAPAPVAAPVGPVDDSEIPF
jgi:hypothetical protein